MGRARFKQLTKQDRILISHWKRKGLGVSEIAVRIGVHKSTISRELRRNSTREEMEDRLEWFQITQLMSREELRHYLLTLTSEQIQSQFGSNENWCALDAQRAHDHRLLVANQLRRRKHEKTRDWVIERLKQHWSPAQIAGRSKLDAPEPVSYEYVYLLIKADRKRGGTLHRFLKRYRKRKQRFGARVYPTGPIIPNRTGIEHRPSLVEKRKRLGDLEGDLIQGYRSSGYILSLVDRKSKYVILRKLKKKKKTKVREQLNLAIDHLLPVHTLTLDNGSEFSDHENVTNHTGVSVYFCHPYCSTERGTIENTNGLVRYFLPKKTCFKRVGQRKLNEIQDLLNNRPRKCLKFLTPAEVQLMKPIPPSKAKLLHL